MTNESQKPLNTVPYLSSLPPIVVPVELLTLLGFEKAFLFQHIHFWMHKNAANGQNYHDGRYWTYNSIPELHRRYPFLKEHQIKHALLKLQEMGLTIEGDYSKNRFKRKTYRTIDMDKYEEFVNDNQERLFSIRQNCLIDENDENSDSQEEGGSVRSIRQNCLMGERNLSDHITVKKHNSTLTSYKKNAHARSENIKEQVEDLIEVPTDWDPSIELVEKIRAEVSKYKKIELTEEEINAAVPKFRAYYRSKGKMVVDIDAAFQFWCSNMKIKKIETISVVTKGDKTPAQTLWSKILEYWISKSKQLEMSRCGLLRLSPGHLNGDYLTVEAPESIKTELDVQRCQEFVVDACRCIKSPVNRVEFVWC